MKKYLSARRYRPISEINVVPYIDVMLVLLVIFVITAPLLSQGVRVNLPQAQAKALSVKAQTPIIVTVDKRGRYYLSDSDNPNVLMMPQQLMTSIAAELALAQENHQPQPTILVKGDKDVIYGKIVQTMVLLQHAGVKKVGLMTETPKIAKGKPQP